MRRLESNHWMTAALVVVTAFAAVGSSRAEKSIADRVRDMAPIDRVTYLNEMLETGKVDPVIHFHLGNAWYALEHPDSAVAHFHRATKLDPAYARAWVNLGIVYDERAQFAAAQQAYRSAIEANPKDVLAYCHLGHSRFSQGDYAEAIELYVQALEIDPNSAQAHYNLGLAFAETRVFAEAIVEWTRVIELDPDGQLGKIATENLELIKTYMDLGQ